MKKKLLTFLAVVAFLVVVVVIIVQTNKKEPDQLEYVKNSPSIAECGYDIADIPSPQVDKGDWISNPDGILELLYIDSINSAINKFNAESTVQLSVVAVNKINACDIDSFASNLFNYWGVGYPDVNNGILVLLDKEDRAITIRTGFGTEIVLTDSICNSLIENKMIPYFNNGDYSAGIFNGIKTMIEEINCAPNKHILVSKRVKR